MVDAISAKSAWARAGIAARILLHAKTWSEGGHGLCRSFDNCFEMGDGDEVHRLLMARAQGDADLVAAMKQHGCENWLRDAGLAGILAPS